MLGPEYAPTFTARANRNCFEIIPFEEHYTPVWDELVERAPAATFLHTRRFLSYHAKRFEDRSLLVFQDGRCRAVFPAAVAPENESWITSHPGLTYGGLVRDPGLKGEAVYEALKSISQHYEKYWGVERINYKAVPFFYHASPAQDDIHALFRLGATMYRCDLSALIDLSSIPPPSRGRAGNKRMAARLGAGTIFDSNDWQAFWLILENKLADKFAVKPVHSLEEILHLKSMFPTEIELALSVLDGTPVAGAVLFNTPAVCHVQYLASNRRGENAAALIATLYSAIERAKDRGQTYFDFGISTEAEGRILNSGLYEFKTRFGAGGAIYSTYFF
jgi:hypothetical protein